MSRLSRQCRILNISQPYRPPQPVVISFQEPPLASQCFWIRLVPRRNCWNLPWEGLANICENNSYVGVEVMVLALACTCPGWGVKYQLTDIDHTRLHGRIFSRWPPHPLSRVHADGNGLTTCTLSFPPLWVADKLRAEISVYCQALWHPGRLIE
jgi:hypothetical protein